MSNRRDLGHSETGRLAVLLEGVVPAGKTGAWLVEGFLFRRYRSDPRYPRLAALVDDAGFERLRENDFLPFHFPDVQPLVHTYVRCPFVILAYRSSLPFGRSFYLLLCSKTPR